MARLVARNASIALDDNTGASRVLSALTSNITLDFTAESVDVTGFGNPARERLTDAISDWTLNVDGFWSATALETDAVLAGIQGDSGSPGATRFRLGPGGSSSGCPCYSGCGVLTKYDINLTAAESAKISFTVMARSGSLTRGAYA